MIVMIVVIVGGMKRTSPMSFDPRLQEIASELRKKITNNCNCKECERLRGLLDYIVGLERKQEEENQKDVA